MTVYVDDMRAPFRGFVMCHMIADSIDELHEFAERIGLKRAWFQRDHYDISRSKRAEALKNGAIEITWEQLAFMCDRLKLTGSCGDPADARRWFLEERDGLVAALFESKGYKKIDGRWVPPDKTR